MKIEGASGPQMSKMPKIDHYPENAQNYPDFGPEKFGCPKSVKGGCFWHRVLDIFFIAPLSDQHCNADISRSRLKMPKIDHFSTAPILTQILVKESLNGQNRSKMDVFGPVDSCFF